jgi:hypothetical protein
MEEYEKYMKTESETAKPVAPTEKFNEEEDFEEGAFEEYRDDYE